ncbi:O-antigen polymerase [Fusobacterium varium]|uniref:O-antigen polymerase n=1 Tax=Fusobacterium varium TaxID=856 RepID=UPI0024307E10|nr:O-antigen polymerase [Fusobacterium varium]
MINILIYLSYKKMVEFITSISIYFFLKLFEVGYLSKKYFKKKLNYFSINFAVYLGVDLMTYVISPIFLIDKITQNNYFIFSINIVNLALLIRISLLIFITIIFKNINKIKFRQFEKKITRNDLKNLSFLFLIFFFIMFIIWSKNFGVINWIINPRKGYQYYRSGLGSFYALGLTFLSLSLTFRMISVKKKKEYYFWFLIYFGMIYIFGSKGRIIDFYIFIIWIGIYKNFIKVKGVLLVGIIGFAIIIYNLSTSYSEINIGKFIKYFDYTKNSTMYYEAYFQNKIELFYGKVYISNFWKYVPRTLFQNKPYVYGKIMINEFFFPGLAAKTHTPSFGGEEIGYFADFGIIGVIFFSLINLKLYLYPLGLRYIFYNKNIITNEFTKLMVFVFIFSPRYGDYFPFGLQLILSILLFLFIYVYLKLKRKW